MFTVFTCLRDEHDLKMVALAAVVCVVASVATMRLHRRNTSGSGAWRSLLTVLTGLVAGAGVWATHFIAMLAYQVDLPIQYDLALTAASLAVAILGMGAGFALAARRPGPAWLVVAGAVIGLSIVGMHFTGIGAIRSMFGMEWRSGHVAASIVLAILGSCAALFAGQKARGLKAWIVPPALLVLAIVALHFTAMAAIQLVPDLTLPSVHDGVDRAGLATMVGVVALIIIATAAGVGVVEAQGREAGRRNLHAAFQGVPLGLAMFDTHGRLALWNEAYQALMANIGIKPFLGATRYDLAKQVAMSGHVPPPEHGDLDRWARETAEERATGLAKESHASNGVWLRMEMKRLSNGDTVTVVTDITESKNAAGKMAEARDRAEAASRAKSEFLANMSHEIRTPLNGILGMTQVIEADDLTDAQRTRMKVVKESGGALLAILDDILDLSKVQAGKLELDVGEVDLIKLANTVVAAFDGAASARDIALKVSVSEGVSGRWSGDPVRLRQILANLVGNALKFTHEGEVRLSLERSNNGVEFRIFDTGIGIADEHLPHLFDKFAQADATTTRRYGGTGLGLAICQELAVLMGGTITVRSEVGKGSCFTFALPTVYVGPSQAAADAETTTAGLVQDGQRLCILAAEDNATNQLVLRSLLEPIDCDLTVVADGVQAVEAFKKGGFDLVLMDVQMPEMNGVEATAAIRAFEAAAGRRRTPIVALSANVMKHQIEEYLASGMDHWVAKPIELEKLYAGIDLVLSQVEDVERDAAA